MRHLADYVLVWSTRFAGNPGDDIAKSPHMARISGSVYKDIKPNLFGMDKYILLLFKKVYFYIFLIEI